MSDANALLMSSGAPSAKFVNIGDKVVGTITDVSTSQQREFKTGKPEVWDDGKPKMQLVITLATDERDPSIEADDGTRRVYAPAWAKPGSVFDALRNAVKAAGASGLDNGGKLAVVFTGTEAQDAGLSPRKLYEAKYAPPAAAAANDLLGVPAAQAAPAVTAVTADDLF